MLTYHVVPGRYTSTKLREMIQEGHGQATLKTVKFTNAFCVLLKGSFDATGKERSMTKTILISAETLSVHEVEVVNHWPA